MNQKYKFKFPIPAELIVVRDYLFLALLLVIVNKLMLGCISFNLFFFIYSRGVKLNFIVALSGVSVRDSTYLGSLGCVGG